MYLLNLFIIGLVALCISWIKHLSSFLKISYSIIFVSIGVVLFSAIKQLPFSLPQYNESLTMHMTELMVIVALMGAGLRINTPFSIYNWNIPLRLVGIALPLTLLLTFLTGFYWLNLGIATSVLLAAVLSPTDPVLAADVQVGPPNKENENSVKLGLTAEAGLSDGLIFPITWLAVFLTQSTEFNQHGIINWISYELLYRLIVACLIGFGVGKCISYLFFYLPKKLNWNHLQEGLVALSTALFVYGLTELLHGYGFIAVFTCAVTIRNYEIHHAYHSILHSFINQIEQILMAILLLLFGGNLADGALENVDLSLIAIALAFVFLIRPFCGMLALMGSRLKIKERLIASFYGIRGVGSFFYLFFAFESASFYHEEQMLSLVYLVVLFSLLFHGISAPRLMRFLNKK